MVMEITGESKITMNIKCDYCNKPASLIFGAQLYPHRRDLVDKRFWHCAECKAWVGCHAGKQNKPLGRLANAELRKAKQAAHAAFDPVWRSGRMKRKDAYAWLADELGISFANCHIGMFDVDGCKAVIAVVKKNE